MLSVGAFANDQDIGAAAPPGSASYTNGTYTLAGGGSDIGGDSDQFHFTSNPLTGDASLVADVTSLTNTDAAAKAGVMIRSDVSAGAVFASVLVTPQNGLLFEWRATAGASASSFAVPSVTGPVWVKLSQSAGSFTASYSVNDIQWNSVGAAQTIAMPSATALAGLAVTSHNPAALNTATFSGVSIAQGGWTARDIGAPAVTGSATYDAPGDTYTLQGSGADINGASDQFTFVSRPMKGDGTIAAYVNSIRPASGFPADPLAKAGVVLRADDSTGSAFAGVFVTAQSGLIFEWRSSAGGAVQQQAIAALAAPISLKLTRSGNSFAAYYATDGFIWNPIGAAQSIVMPASVAAGMVVTSHNPSALCTATFSSVGVGSSLQPGAGVYSTDDQLFLNDLEMREAQFFYDETNPSTGLIPDNSNANGGSASGYSSIAAIGFGLTALTIADARGWLSHAAAYQRALTTLNFLYTTAASVNGFFYHFLNPTTGARSPGTELSSVDTAELMAGVLSAGQYWSGTAVQTTATNLYNRVNWPWMQQPGGIFYGAWTPETGYQGGYGDFSEAVVLYLLGLGSPTHPITRASWLSWSRTPVFNYKGTTYTTADDAALFTVQYPQAWFDLRGLADRTGLNYYDNARTTTLVQRQWMTDLSSTYSDWGPNMWGLTPSDSVHGYAVWGGPPATGPIDGTVVPTGPGGSLEFTPRQSIDALKYMMQTFPVTYKKYGLVDSFNPLTSFISPLVLGIDIGMTLIAAENARSNFVWSYFNQSSVARQSLASAFSTIAPQLIGAASRKTTPGFVVVDLPLNVSGTESVENRVGGPTQLVLSFDANIVKGPGFSVSANAGSVSSTSVSGSTLTINLAGVGDASSLLLSINDIRHFSDTTAGNYTLSVGALLADTNQDGVVNALDFNAVATNFGASGKDSSQGDVNVDGTVNTLDFNFLASAFGNRIVMPSPAMAALSSASKTPNLFSDHSIDDDGPELWGVL